MRDLLGPYGVPDPTDTDPYDYDSDGLPFDAPDGYAVGDYWLREQLLAQQSHEATRKAWARTPRADELADVLACVRVIVAEMEGSAERFQRERVWDAARRLGYSAEEGRVIERALIEGGLVTVAAMRQREDGSMAFAYRLP